MAARGNTKNTRPRTLRTSTTVDHTCHSQADPGVGPRQPDDNFLPAGEHPEPVRDVHLGQEKGDEGHLYVQQQAQKSTREMVQGEGQSAQQALRL